MKWKVVVDTAVCRCLLSRNGYRCSALSVKDCFTWSACNASDPLSCAVTSSSSLGVAIAPRMEKSFASGSILIGKRTVKVLGTLNKINEHLNLYSH